MNGAALTLGLAGGLVALGFAVRRGSRRGIQTPLNIRVMPGKMPMLREGNHRLQAAIQLGMDEVPVVIDYFGRAEREMRVAPSAQRIKANQIRIVADDKTMGSPNTVTPAGFDRTAMSRSEPSAPVRHLQTHAPALLQGRILDFGSGQGVDAKALGATAYDPHHPSARVRTLPKGPFDTVLGLYVLNVLPPTERAAALRLAASAVKPGGSLVLAVRPSADVASTAQGWTRHKDGHQVMGTDGTRDRFQRGFSPAQLRQYATRTLGGAFSPVDVPALSGSVLLVLRRAR